MLQAEGLYRKGDLCRGRGARERHARQERASGNHRVRRDVAGSRRNASCVPKVPVAPYNVVACGNLWEAMKYEKRIETAYTSYAPWYLDSRGWGDLPVDTPLFWAVPFQELQARGRAISSLYGAGSRRGQRGRLDRGQGNVRLVIR